MDIEWIYESFFHFFFLFLVSKKERKTLIFLDEHTEQTERKCIWDIKTSRQKKKNNENKK